MDKNKLKFRVWDKFKHKWLNNFNINLCSEDFTDLNNIEINQYTGLNDVSGNPIFDGDILITQTGMHAKVFFENGTFKVLYKKNTSSYVAQSLDTFTNEYKIQIIGNIYQI